MTTTTASIITMTDAAAERVKALMSEHDEPVKGLRIGVVPGGCSGMSYFIEYATEEHADEDVVDEKGVKLFIDPSAVMYLLGSQMDYVEDGMRSGFVFKNPNEKGRCGCGESFSA